MRPEAVFALGRLHLDADVVLANLLDHLRLGQPRLGFFIGSGPDLTRGHDLDLGAGGREDLDHAVDVDDFETPALGQRVGARPLIGGFSAGDVERQPVLADFDVARDSGGEPGTTTSISLGNRMLLNTFGR